MTTSLTLQQNGEPGQAKVQVVLPNHAVWTVPNNHAGETLHVVDGTVWLTFDSEGSDHVLKAGQGIKLPHHATTVVQGLPEAKIEVA